jgi:hypothetical protein
MSYSPLDPSRRKVSQGQLAQSRTKAEGSISTIAPLSNASIQRARQQPGMLNSNELLRAQSTMGNRAVLRLLAGELRHKSAAEITAPAAPTIGPEGGEAPHDLARTIQRSQAGGKALPEAIRRRTEQATGDDYSSVRVHDGAHAHAINEQLGASASTVGRDIFLGKAQSAHDLPLMAHELAHVSQQRGSGAPQLQRKINFKYSDVPKGIRNRVKKSLFKEGDPQLAQLLNELRIYEAATKVSQEVKHLKNLRTLAEQWLQQNVNSNDIGKQNLVNIIYQQVVPELARARHDHTKLQQQQESDYMGDIAQSINSKDLDSEFWFSQGAKPSYQTSMSISTGKTDNNKPGMTDETLKVYKQHHLTPAQLAGIQTYTFEDYKYINPSMAGNEGWLKGASKSFDDTKLKKKHFESGKKQDPTKANEKFKPSQVDSDEAFDANKDSIVKQGKAHAKFAKRGLKKLPDWSGTLYRGEGLDDGRLRSMQKLHNSGRPHTLNHFWSMSKDRAISEHFLKTATGTPVLFIAGVQKGKDVEQISFNDKEKEVIMLPGSQFTITGIQDSTLEGKPIKVITLTEI